LNPTDEFRSLLAEGRSRDEALGELRRTGASPIQCIKAIHEVEGASLATAKRLFTESRSWSDVVENTEACSSRPRRNSILPPLTRSSRKVLEQILRELELVVGS
jgi:hypothetical protein